MQLPRAWFEQAVTTLEAPALAAQAGQPSSAGPAGVQRRSEPRVGLRARVTLIPLTEGDELAAGPIEVPLRDLSPGGIGFLYADKVPLDAQFVGILPLGDDSVAVLCQVAYYQPLGERLFAVGAEFVRVLRRPAGADDEAAATTTPLPATQPAPRRRAAS